MLHLLLEHGLYRAACGLGWVGLVNAGANRWRESNQRSSES